jgi:predicted PP-loop superfamily ATPase
MDIGYVRVESGDCAGAGLFDTKVTASDNILRNVGEAEMADLAHLVENSCMSCNRLLNRSEIKVVPPRYVQERDQYVKAGAVNRRLMCINCYNALRKVTRTRVRYRDTAVARKGFFVKSIINNVLLRQ